MNRFYFCWLMSLAFNFQYMSMHEDLHISDLKYWGFCFMASVCLFAAFSTLKGDKNDRP